MRPTSTLVAAMVATRLLGVPSDLLGQSIRITGVTTFQYLDVRTLGDDSIPVAEAVGNGLFRTTDEGFVVRCMDGDPYCRFRRVQPSESTIPAIQDLAINVWGLARGVRLYGRLRGRGMVVGDESLWPRADDLVDVEAAYIEINRSTWRGRAGRVWKTSGLGYHNFDGVSLNVQPADQVTVEAYGGRSLARGIHETHTSDDLAAIEPFAPDERAYVIGAQFGWRPQVGSALSAHYQREIRTDRAGLYAERLALDGVLRTGLTTVDAGFEYDLSASEVNEGRIRIWLPPFGSFSINGYARHHRPFFELWTIWGAFSPLGYDEIGASTSWRKRESPLTFDAWAGARWYDRAVADTLFGNFRSNGWRIGLSAATQVASLWRVMGQYRADIGFGAARSDGSIRIERDWGEGNSIGVNGSAFQRLYEFRVDESTTLGFGVDARVRAGSRTLLIGDLTAYRHTSPAEQGVDWTQLRGSLRFEWTVGAEPTVSRRATGLQ